MPGMQGAAKLDLCLAERPADICSTRSAACSLSASIEGHEREDLAHQVADDAMLAIIKKLGQFRGESRFTSWAYKFVVLEVSTQLGRRVRQQVTVQVGDDAWERIPDRLGIDPARHAESVELVDALRAAVTGSLTERQRRVFVALVVDGVPLDSLADELGSTRNAIYKMMFDARRKIRAHLAAHGYVREERPRVTGKGGLGHEARLRVTRDRGQQAVEVFAARAARGQVSGYPRIPASGVPAFHDEVHVYVQHLHRPLAADVGRVGSQEGV
jgi:RNA polymerase sigma-70 factor, ECF subfamily